MRVALKKKWAKQGDPQTPGLQLHHTFLEMPLEDKTHTIPSMLPQGQPIKLPNSVLHWRVLYVPSLFLLASVYLDIHFLARCSPQKKHVQFQQSE